MDPTIIRAGKANMFLSDVFSQSFVNATEVPVELYETDGSIGAALGAGVGAGYYSDPVSAFANRKPLKIIEPSDSPAYHLIYNEWKVLLETQLHKLKKVDSILSNA